MIHISKKISFWAYSKCTHSLDRYAPGVAKYRHKFDLLFGAGKFRRFRRYKDTNGNVKRTVEIEL